MLPPQCVCLLRVNDQHNIEIHQHREAWLRRPLLRSVYRDFHEHIAARLRRDVKGQIVEIGSGIGSIKEVVPECVTSDFYPNPWLDRQENAYRLSFADASVSNLILFDVWHHLEFPGNALAEFRRVLAPGGRLIVFEPDMGLLGRLVYTFGHHEPVAFRQPISWQAPEGFPLDDPPYFAAQSRAHRVWVRGEGCSHLQGWRVIETCRIASLAYLASGGFSKPPLVPLALHGLVRAFDGLLSLLPALFSVRLLVVLEQEPHTGSTSTSIPPP